jgi:TonB family protein
MKAFPYIGIGMLCLCLLPAPADAQESLVHAKGLYDSASYSEALSALNQVPSTADVVEVEKYRALCLLALNRPKDAEQSLERLAMARPLFTLDGADASPKLVSMFQDVRKRTMPEASKQAYQRARSTYEKGDMAEAAQQFRDVLKMVDVTSPENAAMMDDLKMISAGFLKLAEAALAAKAEVRASAAPSAAPVTERAVPPAIAEKPAAPAATTSTTQLRAPVQPTPKTTPRTEALAAAMKARAALSAGDRIYDASDTTVKAAVSIARPIPTWERPASLNFVAFQGLVEVIVAEDGSVADATMVKPINAAYDRLLLETVQKWRFQPATTENRPVKYRMTYSIVMPPVKR